MLIHSLQNKRVARVLFKIEGDSLSSGTLSLASEQMRDVTFWKTPFTQHFILSQLPDYRLSKFQQALPDIYSLEMISYYLLDVLGVIQFLRLKATHN